MIALTGQTQRRPGNMLKGLSEMKKKHRSQFSEPRSCSSNRKVTGDNPEKKHDKRKPKRRTETAKQAHKHEKQKHKEGSSTFPVPPPQTRGNSARTPAPASGGLAGPGPGSRPGRRPRFPPGGTADATAQSTLGRPPTRQLGTWNCSGRRALRTILHGGCYDSLLDWDGSPQLARSVNYLHRHRLAPCWLFRSPPHSRVCYRASHSTFGVGRALSRLVARSHRPVVVFLLP